MSNIFENYIIYDCAICDTDYYIICAEERLPEDEFDYYSNRGRTQVGFYDPNNQDSGEPSWGGRIFPENSFYNSRVVNTADSEYILSDNTGEVFYGGLGENKHREDTLSKFLRVKNLVNINGVIFGVGAARKVTKRIGPDNWILLSESIQIKTDEIVYDGFSDLDGFHENDLYAVGGDPDIWRYDGDEWHQLDVTDGPFMPECVCCASDGYVYIGGAWGMIVRGRDDEWESYMEVNDSGQFKNSTFFSAVNYKGRVFFGSEEGVFVLDENSPKLEYKKYDFEGQISPFAAKRMDVGYGLMMCVSEYKVAIFDGEQWKVIYGGGPSDRERAFLLEQMHQNAEDIVDALQDIRDQLKKDSK
jgi:hypothetical protein